MKILLPLILAVVVHATGQQSSSPTLAVLKENTNAPWMGYVFVIDIDKRQTKQDVEKISNWEFIGTNDKIIVRPGPGKLQACQLIVDVRDIYTTESGEKKLKPGVKIMANKGGEFWYVKEFTSTNKYRSTIVNEENANTDSSD